MKNFEENFLKEKLTSNDELSCGRRLADCGTSATGVNTGVLPDNVPDFEYHLFSDNRLEELGRRRQFDAIDVPCDRWQRICADLTLQSERNHNLISPNDVYLNIFSLH
jgi:hypothetical protein